LGGYQAQKAVVIGGSRIVGISLAPRNLEPLVADPHVQLFFDFLIIRGV
jgi:hypothetical protein